MPCSVVVLAFAGWASDLGPSLFELPLPGDFVRKSFQDPLVTSTLYLRNSLSSHEVYLASPLREQVCG
jgi:hypothetical protein